MDRIGAAFLGHADNLRDRQIGGNGAKALADLIRLVGLEAMQREFVFLGIDRDGLLPHLIGSPHHADGNLTPVGNQNLLKVVTS